MTGLCLLLSLAPLTACTNAPRVVPATDPNGECHRVKKPAKTVKGPDGKLTYKDGDSADYVSDLGAMVDTCVAFLHPPVYGPPAPKK